MLVDIAKLRIFSPFGVIIRTDFYNESSQKRKTEVKMNCMHICDRPSQRTNIRNQNYHSELFSNEAALRACTI